MALPRSKIMSKLPHIRPAPISATCSWLFLPVRICFDSGVYTFLNNIPGITDIYGITEKTPGMPLTHKSLREPEKKDGAYRTQATKVRRRFS